MSETVTDEPTRSPATLLRWRRPTTPREWTRFVGSVVGLLLFIAAVVVVTREGAGLTGVIDHVIHAPPWLLALSLALPALNWLVVSFALGVLTRRFGRVPYGEMAALIGAAWLLNYLPMRPGLFGRVAYHKRFHGVRVKDSARVLIESLVLSAIAIAVLLGLSFLAGDDPLAASLIIAAPGAVSLAAARAVKPDPAARFTAAFALRYLDVAVWVARYAAVFALVGAPLGAAEAAQLAAISQLVLLIPVAGNGLGLREWAIGLAAPGGLAADVTHRALELAVSLVVGLFSGLAVTRRLRATDVEPTA